MPIKKTLSKRLGKKYYIAMKPGHGEHFKLIDNGKPFKFADWIETFVFRDDERRRWSITEVRTGATIGEGDTQKRALERANALLDKLGKDKWLTRIEEFVKQFGEAPKVAVDN